MPDNFAEQGKCCNFAKHYIHILSGSSLLFMIQDIDTDFVNQTYSDVVKNSELVMEDDTANDLAETVFNCKRQIKELTSIMEEAQNKLKDRLKENEIGYTKDYTIKWSPRSQKRVDNDKLKKEYPEVYQEVLKTISFRTMSVKGAN